MLKGLFKKKTPFGKFTAHLYTIFQTEPEFYMEESTIDGVSGVTSFIYKDIPKKGMITGVTYGLSLVNYPEWKFGRPELMITVNSNDISWAKSAGFLANSLRGNCPFSYSNIINFRKKITDESEMDAFLVFAPSILEKNDFSNINIGLNYKVNIAGLYPIYASEMKYIEKNGLEKFWKHPNFDMYDVARKHVK
ncbi:suppressor of fused protein SUFU [Kordia periserrulae]|uniref:Suppressor of fused protein SUFU n=1 Tax=Kordia periserrulae TaxID=701523 RepID=A0A2T6BTS5_9FLAO|nr:suppressor of fused domain protein [Kordia periserrulae]PTX59449.1 suppressor of fused protein SUFU [Kordia periserrulae]